MNKIVPVYRTTEKRDLNNNKNYIPTTNHLKCFFDEEAN